MGKLFLLIKSLLSSIVMLGYLGTHANAALSAGDIAFVGFNADDNDDFAFVALVLKTSQNQKTHYTHPNLKSPSAIS
jgi:hypothetical protein